MQNYNSKFILSISILISSIIYIIFFFVSSAHFICNENVCKMEQRTFAGILRNETNINWSEIQSFETRADLRDYLFSRGHHRRLRWTIMARLHNGHEYDFFGTNSNRQSKANRIVRQLNKHLNSNIPLNIDIRYP